MQEGDLVDLSSKFYTFVPHKLRNDFSNIIDTQDKLKEKLELVQNLSDIRIAHTLIDRPEKQGK